MSGGVDSSVAAALLAEQGHDVIGLSMQLYDHSGEMTFGSCCSLDDLYDARRVAAAINIPHYILNFEKQFNEHVVSNFVGEYAAGRTPLPCAHCNSDLKFTTLLDRANGFGADAVATGHYARVERTARGTIQLKRGVDPSKDQSYFLFSLTQAQLARAVFPVGDRAKDAVRDYAQRRGLPVAAKPDSQEICFVPDHDYARFLTTHSPEIARAGDVVDEDGHVLALRPDDRQVVVGPKTSLERTTMTASGVNWIEGVPDGTVRAAVQIRHRHPAASATVRSLGDSRAEVIFDAPQIAITPGQAAVFYDGDIVAGGGWID